MSFYKRMLIIMSVLFFVLVSTNIFLLANIRESAYIINLSGSQRMRTLLIANTLNHDITGNNADYYELESIIETYNENFGILQNYTRNIQFKKERLDILLDEILSSKSIYLLKVKNCLNYKECPRTIYSESVNLKDEIDELVDLYQDRYDSFLYYFNIFNLSLAVIFPLLFTIFLKLINKKYSHDHLTGAFTRRALHQRYKHFEYAHFIYIDLDYFKIVNDIYGHGAGDFVLKTVAARLMQLFPKGDLFRVGGDEFVIIQDCQNSVSGNCETCNIASVDCKKILKSIQQDIYNETRNEHYRISCSIGYLNVKNFQNKALESYIELADEAMLQAKKRGAGQFQVVDKYFFEEYQIRSNITLYFQSKEIDELIIPYFQPIMNIDKNKVIGVEILARMRYLESILTPKYFIDVINKSNLSFKLDMYMYDEALKHIKDLHQNKLVDQNFTMSINFSPYTLTKLSVFDLLEKAKINQISLKQIQIEVLETANLTHLAINHLEELKMAGMQVAIDDFTAGHSSLNYLKNSFYTTIKLDRMILPTANQDKDKDIYSSIVKVLERLDTKLIAEGVETKEQLEFIKSLRIKFVQGFYYSKALDFDSLKNFLNQ